MCYLFYAILLACTVGLHRVIGDIFTLDGTVVQAKDLCKPRSLRRSLVQAVVKATSQSQGCYRYFPKVSPIFDIDAGFISIVDTDIDTLP